MLNKQNVFSYMHQKTGLLWLWGQGMETTSPLQLGAWVILVKIDFSLHDFFPIDPQSSRVAHNVYPLIIAFILDLNSLRKAA